MMAINASSPAPERLPVAEQVIISAGNILAAAGFRRDEIALFFRQAADHLDPGAAGAAAPASPSPAPEQAAASRKDAILRGLGSIPPVAALQDLSADAGAPLLDRFDLAMRSIPHVAAAQDWLRTAAAEAGLALVAEEQRQADDAGAIRFEEVHAAYAAGFDLIASVAMALATEGDEEAFNLLLMSLVENSVVISRDLKAAIETAAGRLAAAAPGR
jgi:hypothetical protein